MALAPHLLGALVAVLASSAFFLVAAEIRRRPVSDGARVARDLLSAWWLSAGIYGLLWAGAAYVMAALGIADVRPYVAVRTLALLVILGGQWALTAHFAYLLTGSRRAFVPLAIFFAFTYGIIAFAYAGLTAVGVETDLIIDIVYDPAPEPWMFGTILALISAPQLVAAIGYLALARTAEDPIARRRARLVAAALVLWLGSGVAAAISQQETWRFLTRPVLGIAAAATVYFAYRPIRWAAAEPHSAFDRRMRELI